MSKTIITYIKKYQSIIIFISLLAIFFFAFYLRSLFLPDNLFFGFEQGRDAFVAKDIISGAKYTLLGPKTDILGIYHGVLYYYYLSGVYLLANMSPAGAIFLFTLFGSFIAVLIYLLAYEFTDDKLYSLFAALISALSFNLISYSRWLSNVSPSIIIAGLFFLFLAKLAKSNNIKFWPLVLLTYGLLFHFEILHGLYGLFIIALSVRRFNISIKNKFFYLGLILLFLTLSPFIVFEFRHDFLQTKAIFSYIGGQSLSTEPISILKTYFDGYIKEIMTTIFPVNGVLLLGLIIYSLYFYKKVYPQSIKDKKSAQLLFLFCFWNLPYIFLIKEEPQMQFYAGTSIALIITFVYLLKKTVFKYNRYVLLVIIIYIFFANFAYINRALATTDKIFFQSSQKYLTYNNQINIFDYMFSRSHQPFTFDAFTIPYYHKQAWEYLYHWYGPKKYPDQYLKNQQTENPQLIYLINEVKGGDYLKDRWFSEYDQFSTTSAKIDFGDIELHIRKRIK